MGPFFEDLEKASCPKNSQALVFGLCLVLSEKYLQFVAALGFPLSTVLC